jgi:hypothetical protein
MSWSIVDDTQSPGWADIRSLVTIEETSAFGDSNFSSVAFASSIIATYPAAATTWAQINNAQTTNWQNMNNAQSPTWVNINDGQTPGWTPVNS